MTITRDHPWVGDPQENPVVVGIEPGQDPRVLDRAREFAERLSTGMLCVWVDPVHLMAATPAGGVPLADPPDDAAGGYAGAPGAAGAAAGSDDTNSAPGGTAAGRPAATGGTTSDPHATDEARLAPEAVRSGSTAVRAPSSGQHQVPTDTEALLMADLRRHLDGREVSWRFVYTAGEAPRGLARVAREYQAPAVVVGSRRPGPGGWMNEMFGGSVAGHLSHTQETPVLVVPLSPRRH